MSTRNEPVVCRPGEALDCFLRTTRLGRTDFAREALGWRAERGIENMCRDAWRWQQWQAEHAAEL